MERTNPRRGRLAVLWACIGVALIVAMFVISWTAPHRPRGVGKGFAVRDDWEQLRLAAYLLCPLLAGTAFGAALGVWRGRVRYWPAAGAIGSVAALFLLSIVVCLYTDVIARKWAPEPGTECHGAPPRYSVQPKSAERADPLETSANQ